MDKLMDTEAVETGEPVVWREAALLAFVLRCSADNPAAIGNAVSHAINLLERLGIEPREPGTFYNSVEWCEANAAKLLAAIPTAGDPK